MMSDKGGKNIASYSLLIIGLFWAIFGTSALITKENNGSDSSLRPIFLVLFPPPGDVVIRADFTWNLIGVFLILLGLLSYKFTREKIGRYLAVRRVAVVGTSILFLYGSFTLNHGLFFHYEYCYTAGYPGIPGLDCQNSIFSFPQVAFGVVSMLIGSISFAVAMLSNIKVVR
ncbi:MAG: hypothetical protein LYZ70_00055 [Nitrososphaerales archaeon]|nr:hypothetical protein [Nitrososphaerales archaeon]